MLKFREWFLTEARNPNEKPVWSGKKNEILKYWKTLQQDLPINMLPITYNHEGKTYGEDGVRITGSKQFIISVLSHLKELLKYEGKITKLNLVYRGTRYEKSRLPDGTSYVFYVQSQQRTPKAQKENN